MGDKKSESRRKEKGGEGRREGGKEERWVDIMAQSN